MSSWTDDTAVDPAHPDAPRAGAAAGHASNRASSQVTSDELGRTLAAGREDTDGSGGEGGDSAAEDDFDRERDGEIFRGDRGELRVETRRVLVQLLLGPSVDSQRQTKLWPVLIRDEKILRSRLHELFLELVIDREQKVAFTRQVVSELTDVPILLRKAALTFIETALLLFLRQRLTQADAQGERAVVSFTEMTEYLSVFERDSNLDHSRYSQQMGTAIEKVKKLSLLRSVSSGKDRFEVAPTLKLLFSAEEIQHLMASYAAMSAGVRSGESDDPAEPDEERTDL